jgi:hypothetical protein
MIKCQKIAKNSKNYENFFAISPVEVKEGDWSMPGHRVKRDSEGKD